MLKFDYEALPGRVVFGAGSLDRLLDEVARLGAARALVVSTPGHRPVAEDAAERLGVRAAGVWDRAQMHAPIENVEAGRAEARRLAADCCVAIGGGTPIGLAKAIALELAVPIVAVPTTYAGSEMTPVLGITEGGVKRTRRDLRMLPKTVIYDPELTFTLPPAVSGPSGMNAIAHCVEALYAPDGNPLTSLLAEEGIRALAASLPVVVREPEHAEARAEALYGAWLAGTALATVGMALHHKLCHTLGGSFDLPHAEVHTIILPHATAYNRAGAFHAPVAVPATLLVGASFYAAAALLFARQNLWLPVVTPLLVQLPLGLFLGLLLQYRDAHRAKANISRGWATTCRAQGGARLRGGGARPARLKERVFAVCMVTDASRFTTLAEAMAPEELSEFLDRYFAILFGVVERHGGRGDRRGRRRHDLGLDGAAAERACRLRACLAAVEIEPSARRLQRQHHPRSCRPGSA